MTQIEAMKLALEVLEKLKSHISHAMSAHEYAMTHDAIIALREAIQAAEKVGPVGYVYRETMAIGGSKYLAGAIDDQSIAPGTPLYTAPQGSELKSEPLTDERIVAHSRLIRYHSEGPSLSSVIEFGRAIEREVRG